MPRKIYDIKPPKAAKKSKEDLKDFLNVGSSAGSKKKRIVADRSVQREQRSIRWPVSISVLVILLIAGVYLFFKLPKADIVIRPEVNILSFTQAITADKSAATVDLAGNVIPAKYFEASKTDSQDFPATGNASNEGRASGSITIYNKSDPVTPLTFKSGTHFMSDSGKLFVTYQKVVVPAGTKSGSKITPGSIQINVEAVEGGSDYNVAPSNFSVPGLKGTSYYYSIYATSSSPMSGGYAGKVKKVTDDDIQLAKDAVTQKTKLDAVSALKIQIPSDYILLDSAVFSEVTNASADTKSGTVAENFSYSVTAKASTLAFKKSDLEEFAKNYIVSKIPEGKIMVNDPELNYSVGLVDVSKGRAALSLDFSSGISQSIDKNSIALSLLGKNDSQIRETLKSSLGDGVKVEISFWPFWVKSAPNSQKAVNVAIKFQ